MFAFIHKLLNPHCEHCAAERKERIELERLARLEEREEVKEQTHCLSCETLQRQLEIANHEKAQLLDRLLAKPTEPVVTGPPQAITPPRNIPWRVRQQELEAADRERARVLKNAPKPVPIPEAVELPSTDDLEKDVVGGQNV